MGRELRLIHDKTKCELLGQKEGKKAFKHGLRTRDEYCDNTCVAEGQACGEFRRRRK